MGKINVEAAVGGRRLTLDPIKSYTVPLKIDLVESTIPCGFQVEWGNGQYGDDPIEINVGAGFGSKYGTIKFKDKRYCFNVEQLLGAFIDAIGGSESTPEPDTPSDSSDGIES